ncbi:MAG: Rpn family recombination-promoting nuclease/putative transposase [Prevotellaceae bacterium]|nr:Rpn family recombination-promoting nuclease/putative transposase [Prevotellaceae bacterium]
MAKYIRFDWAIKSLLRNKANAVVLEGLLTTLLGEKMTIQKFLESESNQEDQFDKHNRVDILVEDSHGKLFIIEIQNNNEYAYFQRILFGTSKLVTEYVNRGEGYDNIRKIYSINILYFDLGHGKDYVYHGKTEFRGIHSGDLLELSPFQRQKFNVSEVSALYPEYYILKVDGFVRQPENWLEEWVRYLNTDEIPDNATAPGLVEAREMLRISQMSKNEQRAYWRHVDNVNLLKSNVYTERGEGRLEGRAEGLEEGRAEGRAEGRVEGRVEGIEIGRTMERQESERKIVAEKYQIALNFKRLGLPTDTIAQATGLTQEQIEEL